MRGRDEKSISDNFLYMLKAKLFKTRHFFAFARDIMSLRPVICYLWKIKNKKQKREREREKEKREICRGIWLKKMLHTWFITLYFIEFI